MNTGAPISDEGDLFGTVVNVAARITDHADGGQILVSDVVRLLAAGKGFQFRPFGTHCLDGMLETVPLFEVVWQADRDEHAATGRSQLEEDALPGVAEEKEGARDEAGKTDSFAAA